MGHAVRVERIDGLRREIKNNSVRSADVRNGSLAETDLRRGARTRWALVGINGRIEAQSGGFEVEAAYSTTDPPSGGARNNVYIDTGQDLSGKGITATVALQNMVDQGGNAVNSGTNPEADNNPEFSGEISAPKCNVAGLVMCAPKDTNTVSSMQRPAQVILMRRVPGAAASGRLTDRGSCGPETGELYLAA